MSVMNNSIYSTGSFKQKPCLVRDLMQCVNSGSLWLSFCLKFLSHIDGLKNRFIVGVLSKK